jgi:hypothetical protein
MRLSSRRGGQLGNDVLLKLGGVGEDLTVVIGRLSVMILDD